MFILLDILTAAFLLFGLFFMFIGALGIARFPDFYNRMHAGSKCITLGVAGMLIALVLHLGRVPAVEQEDVNMASGDPVVTASAVGTATKAALVIIFQFTAAPVAAHLLARAAHVDRAGQWEGTLSDELEEDCEQSGSRIV